MRRRIVLARLRHQALGLGLLAFIALFVAGTIGFYNKAFTPVATVALETGHAGNQMNEGSDVKIRGVEVGEVRDVSTRGDGATLELALQPDQLELVPADVQAQLLPKTLFGERYVALQEPDEAQTGGSAGHIADGDVIEQDRSENAIELQQVLDDVLPLLQAVEPHKLASALNSVSTALDGRGEQLGETLVLLSDYLDEFNESLPDLEENVTGLADVSETYTEAAPDFLQALSTATTTSQTLVDKRADLTELYSTITTSSGDLQSFFEANKDNIIDLTATAQPTLDILEKYAPQYPCMLRQFADQVPGAETAFGKGTDTPGSNRVTLEFISSRGSYEPGQDEPRYEDTRGPRCYEEGDRENYFPQYPPGGPIEDGSSSPEPPKEPDASEWDYETYESSAQAGSPAAAGPSVANSPMEQRLISMLAAPAVDTEPDDVPGWSSLLVGPLYRGAEVEVR